MEIIKPRKRKPGEHVYIPELQELYRQGRITRREFMRNACLLGMSFAAASMFVTSCGGDDEEEEAATGAGAAIKRGGTLRFGIQIAGFEHPAQFSWDEESVTRHVIEYLTQTDKDNVTHPHMLERWEVSDDLKTWTLHLRKNITWTTGEPFNADDVEFTMKQWLDPDVGSSMLGLLNYLQPTGIEKRDEWTIVLNLDTPQIQVPENLYHYPGPMLDHRTFEGDWLKNPVGTGYMTLEEYSVGERAVLKARTEGYWRNGADGKPLPYLDEIVVVDLGEEDTAYVSALKGGQIDCWEPTVTGFQALKDDPNVVIGGVPTSQTRVLRMRVDMEPWTDVRVRNAVKYCQDREKILKLAYFGEGVIGPDCHVSPAHAAFAPMDPWPYDTERAKALLAEAGYPDGLDVTITVGTGWPDIVSYAEILKEDAEPAGLRININAIPTDSYWDVWTEADFAVTWWTHRPLAIMLLPLAYVCDAEGTPVPWNESRWCDQEFQELLTKAQGILDLEERRKVMADIQKIQVDRGSIGIPYWMNAWIAHNRKFKGFVAHPTDYRDDFSAAWYDPEA